MVKKAHRMRSTALVLLVTFFLVLLLADSRVAMEGAQRGLALCAQTLLPSLFPFLVLSELLVALGVGNLIRPQITRPIMALFGISEKGAVSFLLGCVCGFPVGTTSAVSYAERGEMSKEELHRVSLFCNNPSSGFLLAAVGEGLLGNRSAGVALLIITLLSAVLVGILLRLLFGKITSVQCTRTHAGPERALSVNVLATSVCRAGRAFLTVSAFVIFFSCITECLSHVLDAVALPVPFAVAFHGILEMTGGIGRATATMATDQAFRATAFFASFAGVSVCLQILACAEGHNLSVLRLLAAKALQAGIALLLAELYLRVCQPTFTPTESVIAMTRAPENFFPVFFSLLLLCTLCFSLYKRKSPETGQ